MLLHPVKDQINSFVEKNRQKLLNIRFSYGCLEVFLKKDGKVLMMHYSGNMGSTVERSIDPGLKQIGLPSVSEIKSAYGSKCKEDGYPSYAWNFLIVL